MTHKPSSHSIYSKLSENVCNFKWSIINRNICYGEPWSQIFGKFDFYFRLWDTLCVRYTIRHAANAVKASQSMCQTDVYDASAGHSLSLLLPASQVCWAKEVGYCFASFRLTAQKPKNYWS